jgi:hypothetical protein
MLHHITTVTPVSCPGQPSFISEELHKICAAGAHDRSAIRNVRDLLEEAPLLASARDISGQNALHLLCASQPHTAATVNSLRISPAKATSHALPWAVCDAKSSERSTYFYQVEIANFLFEANKQVHVLSVPVLYNHEQLCIVAGKGLPLHLLCANTELSSSSVDLCRLLIAGFTLQLTPC